MPSLMPVKVFLELMDFKLFEDNDELFHLGLLLGIFLLGFLALIGLNHLFISLEDNLDLEADNERVRMILGKSIVHDLTQLKVNFYQLVTSTNENTNTLKQQELHKTVNSIKTTLNFLQKGGTVERQLALNLAERDSATQVLQYHPDNEQVFVVEVITLLPQLNNLEKQVVQIIDLLKLRHIAREKKDTSAFFKEIKKIKLQIKMTSSIFVRSLEIANNLVYYAEKNMSLIQSKSKQQHKNYLIFEVILITLIFVSVSISGFIFARRIYHTHKKLQYTSEQEKLANKSKSIFFANMSHELRTPMNAIIGYTELIEEDISDLGHTDILEDLYKVKVASKYLLQLINSVLDLSKVESGKMQVYYESFKLISTLHDIAELCRPLIDKNNNVFSLSCANNLPDAVVLDLTKFRQILFNLLSNAAKFTDKGKITLSVYVQKQILFCEVADTGIGIDEDKAEALFEVFNQANESTTRIYGGTGLGLPIARQFAQLMKGNLVAENLPERGSVFRLTLPLNHLPSKVTT